MNHLKLLRNNLVIATGLCLMIVMGAALFDWLSPTTPGAMESIWSLVMAYGEKLAVGLFMAITLPLAWQSPESMERE